MSVGSIPTNHGQTCVFVSAPPEVLRAAMDTGLDSTYVSLLEAGAPELTQALGSAQQIGPLRPFLGAPGFLRRSHGPGWALVGDAEAPVSV